MTSSSCVCILLGWHLPSVLLALAQPPLPQPPSLSLINYHWQWEHHHILVAQLMMGGTATYPFCPWHPWIVRHRQSPIFMYYYLCTSFLRGSLASILYPQTSCQLKGGEDYDIDHVPFIMVCRLCLFPYTQKENLPAFCVTTIVD